MSIQKISPRMQKALRDGVEPQFFGEVWLSVLNDTVDTQTDFESKTSDSNMDYTTRPGYAILSKSNYSLSQTSYNTEQQVAVGSSLWQSVVFANDVIINTVAMKIRNASTSGTALFYIYTSDKSTQIASRTVTIPNGTNDVSANFNNLLLLAGTYWIVYGGGNYYVQYQNTNVYADGQLDYNNLGTWSYNLGDLYFSIAYQGYASTGNTRTKRMDLGEIPTADGTFQLAYALPPGCSIDVTLYAYTAGSGGSPAATISSAVDGQSVPAYRYWEVLCTLNANAAYDDSPAIDMIEFIYPKDRLLLREAGRRLKYVSNAILSAYRAMLKPFTFQSSDIKVIERIASGGSVDTTLTDPTGEVIQKIISDYPLKNFRGILYLGADVPGFTENDLVRFFTGVVNAVKYRPKYRRATAELDLSFKNPILELTRKAPMPSTTGAVDFSTIGLNYDGTHVIWTMLDIIRAQAAIPARYVNMDSFNTALTSIGDGTPPPAAYVVRRGYHATLPDTKIKSPEEVRSLLAPLLIIADGYITEDDSSRIMFVKHDTSATEEATWADENLVRKAGANAIPIEDIADIDMGYDALLYNASVMGCQWDGEGDDWKAITSVFANVDSTSTDEFAPGKAIYLSLMEKNMMDAAKWLGPEIEYNGETLAQELTARLTARFAYPPVIMHGVVLPISEFMRSKGAVVKVWSKEIAKFKRKGIALSETKKFMIISKKLDRDKNRMIFDLLELT